MAIFGNSVDCFIWCFIREWWTRDGVVGAAPALGIMELVTCEGAQGRRGPAEEPRAVHRTWTVLRDSRSLTHQLGLRRCL